MIRRALLYSATFIALSMPAFAEDLPEDPAAPYTYKSAEEVLASASTAEGKGLAIAKEADRRDLGYGDFEVALKMVLRNSQGEESIRENANKTLERPELGVGDKSMIVFDHPRDIKGTALLTFSNILEPDDQWLYLPALKRVKRIASNNKSGSFVGSEFAYEDIASQEVGKYSYKYIKNEPCPNDAAKECFVVERYPLYEDSGYTRQVAWADTKDFQLQKVDFYDRKEAHLKTLTYGDYELYLDRYWRPHEMKMKNVQTGKSTDLIWGEYRFRQGLSDEDFTTAKLKRAR